METTELEKQSLLMQIIAEQRNRLANDNARLILDLELARREIAELKESKA